MGSDGIYGGKAKSKRCVFRYYLQVTTKRAERTDTYNSHIDSSNTSNHYQSAYRKFHLTGSALLNIHNDILASLNAGKVTAVTLFDLSAAFDTIDHTIILRRFDDWFGVTGKALDQFKLYLTDGCQRIRLGDCLSSKPDLKSAVPQVSVLGPLLFTLYTTPLSSMIFEHAIPHHFYADNSELYVPLHHGTLMWH